MPTFTYSQFESPFANTIAQLMAHQNDAYAEAARIKGNLAGRAIEAGAQANAGLIHGLTGLGATIANNVFDAYQNAPVRERQQIALQEAKQQALDTQEQRDARTWFKDTLRQTPMLTENGIQIYDVPTISAKASERGLDPTGFAKQLGGLNDTLREFGTARQAVIVDGAKKIAAAGNDPELALNFLDTLKGNKIVPDEVLTKFRTAIVEQGQPAVERVTSYLIGPQKGIVVPKDATLLDEATHKPIFTGKESGYTLGPGQIRYEGDQPVAWGPDKPAPAPTAEQDKRQYYDIRSRLDRNLPVTPEERAFLQAYETEKTLGVDKSAAAAADRQARGIEQQNKLEGDKQLFAKQERGRQELGTNADKPFATAKQSAETLRESVSAAKAGNKVAASLQALETTMAAIRAQGLNRINMAEIGVTADAGSMFDRISGWLGKKAAGQPIPADVQKDMLEFADILEKAAYHSYEDEFDTITKRYSLADEKKKPPPGAPPEGTVQTVNGETRRWGLYNGTWGWKKQ